MCLLGCNQKQIELIKLSNINTKRHLNRSKLHLNCYEKSILIWNIRNYLTNFNWRNLRANGGTLSTSLSLNNTLLDNDLLKIKEQRLEYPPTNLIGYLNLSWNQWTGFYMITASVMKGLNINSVRNKFDSVIEIIKNFNIFLFWNLILMHHFQKINSK